MKDFYVALFLAACVVSCEGNRTARGFVKDKITGQPIDSVYVEVLSGRDDSYTDSTGFFLVWNEFGGCVPECKDIDLRFSKQGYSTARKINPGDSTVIYLEPTN